MTTIISGAVALIALLVFLASLNRGMDTIETAVGGVYTDAGSGKSGDPTKEQKPWIGIFTIVEIRGDNVRYKAHYLHAEGDSFCGEAWMKTEDLLGSYQRLK